MAKGGAIVLGSSVSILALAIGGCGGGGSSGSSNNNSTGSGEGGSDMTTSSGTAGGGTHISQAAAKGCEDYISAVCDKYEQCIPSRLKLSYADVDDCKSRGPLGCKAAVGLTGSGLTADNLEACASALKSATCDDAIASNEPIEACAKLSRGTLDGGKTCASSTQCLSSECDVKSGDVCGTCAKKLAEGDSCKDGGACSSGLYCTTDGACAKLVEKGEACSASSACRGTSRCVAGKCADALKMGDDCDPANDACDVGADLACDANSKKCSLPTPLAKRGSTCGYDQMAKVLTLCEAGSYCETDGAMSNMGTCKASLDDGATCTVHADNPCRSPAACQNGVCTTSAPVCK